MAGPDWESAAKAFLSKFTDPHGDFITHPAVLAPVEGIDGLQPPRAQHGALESAVMFAVLEVQELLSALLPGGPVRLRLARARVVGRASVVLLSSHFERYFYAVNEEAIAYLNSRNVASDVLPEQLRLVHSAGSIDRMLETQWHNRAAQLTAFIRDESWLWIPGQTGTVLAEKLLGWMKSPKPASLMRYYAYWGIPDIFSHVTRTKTTRARMYLLVSELVDKRNNIAHGEAAEQATRVDVLRYSRTVLTFCARSDRALALIIANRLRVGRPW